MWKQELRKAQILWAEFRDMYCVKELITEKEPMSKVQAIWEQVQLEWNNSEKMIKFRD